MSKPTKKSTSYGLLWLVAGVLIGLFISGLLFLKRNVVVVNPACETIPKKTATPTAAPKKTAAAPQAPKKTNADESTSDQYDFYTMLPNMQVDQKNAGQTTTTKTTPTPTNAAPSTPAPAVSQDQSPPAKPAGRPLDQVEQSMLSRTQPAPTPTTPPTITATPTAPPTKAAPSTPTTNAKVKAPRYMIVVGNYHSADEADAQKAALILSGFDRAKVQSYKKNDITWYRVVIGTFASQDQAKTTLAKIQKNQFTGTVQSTDAH